MQGIAGILWLQAQNRLYNGWLAASPRDYYIDGIRDELAEVREALEQGNYDELELELGDVLWDTLSLIHKLDHEKLINKDRICPRAVAKFAERMPYNVRSVYEGDPEQREQIWQAAKKLQKSRGLNEDHELVKEVWNQVKRDQNPTYNL